MNDRPDNHDDWRDIEYQQDHDAMIDQCYDDEFNEWHDSQV